MYILTFMTLASMCVVLAIHAEIPWLFFPLSYAAFSFAIVGIIYLANKPMWLMKRSCGSVPPASWIIFGPLFLLNASIFHIRRLLSREEATTEIMPGLYLGRMLTNKEAGCVLTPSAVVDLMAEFSEARLLRENPGYRLFSVLDGTAPSIRQLLDGANHIRESLSQGRVYVHCVLGHGRSATMVAAYLLVAGHARKVEEAVGMIRSRRRGISIAPSQVKALRRLEISAG